MKASPKKLDIEQAVKSLKGATPAEKATFRALCDHNAPPEGTYDDRPERFFTAFASMVTNSWKACRHKDCRRARMCLAPDRPITAAPGTVEHSRQLEEQVMPRCLTEPGWHGNLQDIVHEEMRLFADTHKAIMAETVK